jgi:hypothetical protein
MGNFWKIVVMGVVAAGAYVVAKEVIERHENGEDCSPRAVLKGIAKKTSDFFESRCTCCADEFDDFDDFEDFELDDDDDSIDFGTDDMEGDNLTDDGYILEFSAEEEDKPAPAAPETPAEETGDAAETDASDEE